MTIINSKITPESVKEYNEEALLADGFDDAIIGMCLQFGQLPVVAYDYEKCIQILMKDMTRDEALEYFEFNVINAYMGINTPVYIVS
jgi:hypothetical protein|tara:strand:+ start:683 stop:943 length:261 start_codon:yes stop_codon:yes gene_type:complete